MFMMFALHNRLSLDAGYMPGCMMLRIHHAEFLSESEAYGGRVSLSPAGNIAAKAGCYKDGIRAWLKFVGDCNCWLFDYLGTYSYI